MEEDGAGRRTVIASFIEKHIITPFLGRTKHTEGWVNISCLQKVSTFSKLILKSLHRFNAFADNGLAIRQLQDTTPTRKSLEVTFAAKRTGHGRKGKLFAHLKKLLDIGRRVVHGLMRADSDL